MRRSRERRPKKSERRAEVWVARASQGVHLPETGTRDHRIAAAAAYCVRRQVSPDTPGGIFDNGRLQDLLSDNDGKAMRFLGLPLITPGEGRRVALEGPLPPDEVRERLESVSASLPSYRDGFLARSAIVGAKPGKPGPRFVVCVINPDLQQTVKEERQALIEATGFAELADRYYTPRVTLLETHNQSFAEELKHKVGAILAEAAIPVQFGAARVDPVQNHNIVGGPLLPRG